MYRERDQGDPEADVVMTNDPNTVVRESELPLMTSQLGYFCICINKQRLKV